MKNALASKVALVTGGSRGIGAAIVRRLAQEGAAVAFTYASSSAQAKELEAAITSAGGRAYALRADSSSASDPQRAVAETVSRFGALDILINNAGVGEFKPAIELSLEAFDRLMAINVRAVFVASQEAIRQMIAGGRGGRIITIGSTLGERAGMPGAAAYVASKAAVAGLARGLARELGSHGITVNVVEPGPIDTELNPSDGPGADMQKALLAIPRFGRADEVAAMVAFLAGPEAAFTTGASYLVDGGFAA